MQDCFLFNDTATTEIYTLSLHDALPISAVGDLAVQPPLVECLPAGPVVVAGVQMHPDLGRQRGERSEEHTSELQSRQYLVWRLLLEKKNTSNTHFRFLFLSQITRNTT